MNGTPVRQTTTRGRSVLSLMGERERRWEDDIERAWRNAPERGPGFWTVGLCLGRDFLSTFMARKPWRMGPWPGSE